MAPESLGARLRAVLARHRLTQREFAERTGRSLSQVRRYLGDVNQPPHIFLARVASEFGVDERWLVSGEEAFAAHEPASRGVPASDAEAMIARDRIVHIPFVGDLDLPAMRLGEETLIAFGIAPPRAMFCLAGDAGLHPLIDEGDMLLVERGPFASDGLYVIREQTLVLRRLQRRGSRIAVIAEHPCWRETFLSQDEAASHIVRGRAKLVMKRI